MKSALLEAVTPHLPPADRGRSRGQEASEAGTSRPNEPTPEQWRRIGRQVMTLHEGYTQRGVEFSGQHNPIHAALAGYQLYFSPRNLYRVLHLLRELPWNPVPGPQLLEPWVSGRGAGAAMRILDLGCGAGAFSLAWLAWLAERFPGGHHLPALELTLVDQGHQLIDLAKANIQAFTARVLPGIRLKVISRADGVAHFLGDRSRRSQYGVVGAAMMLNEMDLLGPRRVSARSEGLFESLSRQLREGGLLLLIEPGTRKGYMNLMTLRQHLDQWPILYPCPHNLPCPFWGQGVRHWCHATVPLPKGFFFDQTFKGMKALDFDMRHINLAALAVQVSGDLNPRPPFQARTGRRIVSESLKPRGKKKGQPRETGNVLLVCSENGDIAEMKAEGHHYPARGRWIADPMKRRSS